MTWSRMVDRIELSVVDPATKLRVESSEETALVGQALTTGSIWQDGRQRGVVPRFWQ